MVFRRNTQDDPKHVVLENKEMLNEWRGTLKTKTKTKNRESLPGLLMYISGTIWASK